MLFQQLYPGMFLGRDKRYRIDSQLGEGGFGKTYLATDVQLDRSCVIKRPRIEQLLSQAERQELLRNFEREARLLVTLNSPGHPCIPDIYEYLPDSSALVMKYIEGESLEQLLARHGPLSQTEAVSYIREVCDALMYMHSHTPEPILHRDIKPGNILRDKSNRVWLIDFGLSKATLAQRGHAAVQGTRGFGTLGYTPPEQWIGQAVPQSDVYALAATLHELLTTYTSRIRETHAKQVAVGARPTSSIFPPIRQLRPEVSVQIEWLIEQSLADDPAQRLTVREMRTVLDALHKPHRSTATFVIQAPDGTDISSEAELTRWGSANWQKVGTWLYGSLPLQVERFWLRDKLAQDMKDIVVSFPDDRNAGVDMLLRLITTNPSFPSPRVDITPALLDFGAMAIDQQAQRVIKLTNPGPGYVALSFNGSEWMQPSPQTLSLHAGESAKVTVLVDTTSMRHGGTLQTSLFIRSQNGFAYDLPVQVELPFWRTLAHEYWQTCKHVFRTVWSFARRAARSVGVGIAVVAAASLTLIALLLKGLFFAIWIVLRGLSTGIATFFIGGISGLLLGALVGTLANAAITFDASTDDGFFWRVLYAIAGGGSGLLSGSVVGLVSGATSGGVIGAVVRGTDITTNIYVNDIHPAVSIVVGACIGICIVALLRYTNVPGEWVQQFMGWVTPSQAFLTIAYAAVGGGCAGFFASVIAAERYW